MPLDDRPCNRQFPQKLAAIAGWRVLLPPRETLGWFTNAGDCDAVASWLLASPSDSIVVALDMLCFGGLVASRRPETQLTQALTRLALLRELRRQRPEAAIYAFDTITRLGTTVAQQADLETHLALREYCQLLDRAERLGERAAWTQLAEAERRLGPAALQDHLTVRRRNHLVNRAALELTAEGVLDYLVLAQEDAAPTGIHIPEQIALRDEIAEQHLSDRVTLTCGADEMGMALLARHVCNAAGHTPTLAVEYTDARGAEIIPAFESQPLESTVAAHVTLAGARLANEHPAEAVVLLHTPMGEQGDFAADQTAIQTVTRASNVQQVCARVLEALRAELPVGVADLAYCNGGDPALIAALEEGGALPNLSAYAGWNTAANTLGTVIAQLCLTLCAPGDTGPNHTAQRRFLTERLIDDYGYQTLVRPQAAEQARARHADPFNLGEAAEPLQAVISEALLPLAHRYASQVSDSKKAESVRISLPWRRLFEIEVETGPVPSG